MSRYSNIPELKTEDGRRYLSPVIYPTVPESEDDVYVIATAEDRYDTLSMQFYGKADYWWVIAAANSTKKADSLVIDPGTQIRIPVNPETYRRVYQDLND